MEGAPVAAAGPMFGSDFGGLRKRDAPASRRQRTHASHDPRGGAGRADESVSGDRPKTPEVRIEEALRSLETRWPLLAAMAWRHHQAQGKGGLLARPEALTGDFNSLVWAVLQLSPDPWACVCGETGIVTNSCTRCPAPRPVQADPFMLAAIVQHNPEKEIVLGVYVDGGPKPGVLPPTTLCRILRWKPSPPECAAMQRPASESAIAEPPPPVDEQEARLAELRAELTDRCKAFAKMAWRFLAAFAWRRYNLNGRGAVLMPFSAFDRGGDGNYLSACPGWPEVEAAISSYDPERQIVLILVTDESFKDMSSQGHGAVMLRSEVSWFGIVGHQPTPPDAAKASGN